MTAIIISTASPGTIKKEISQKEDLKMMKPGFIMPYNLANFTISSKFRIFYFGQMFNVFPKINGSASKFFFPWRRQIRTDKFPASGLTEGGRFQTERSRSHRPGWI
jgi:hypothetical protein